MEIAKAGWRLAAPRLVLGVPASELRGCPGEMVGIVGRNGAGKSTLLSLIAGLMRADEGSIERSGGGSARCWTWAGACIPG